ncbi:MAG: hypothetical protein ABID87_09045, partial [Chloroflexota bacterium]
AGGRRPRGTRTPAMYRSFVGSLQRHGRVHELEMMFRFYLAVLPDLLRHPRATIAMMPLGLKLLTHRRLPLRSARVKSGSDLPRIIRKFREIRGRP